MILEDLDFSSETSLPSESHVQAKVADKNSHPLGVFKDMPNAEYHSSPAISKSGLDALEKSPSHLWYYQQQGSRGSDAKSLGTIFHDVVLMGLEFASTIYLVEPEFNKRSDNGKRKNIGDGLVCWHLIRCQSLKMIGIYA